MHPIAPSSALAAATLAFSFLAGCGAAPLRTMSGPPLVLLPASEAGISDQRARFREIFCAVLAAKPVADLPEADTSAGRAEPESSASQPANCDRFLQRNCSPCPRGIGTGAAAIGSPSLRLKTDWTSGFSPSGGRSAA